jgi:hypothetical protein
VPAARDAPACLLPSGKVVCMGGTTVQVSTMEGLDYLSFNPVLLEYDPASTVTGSTTSAPETSTPSPNTSEPPPTSAPN